MTSAGSEQRPITVRDFGERKRKGEKIVVMTAYDALFGRLVDESGVDATKKEAGEPPFLLPSQDQAPRLALAWSAIFAKAGLSNTARSASTLRSRSMAAFFSPFMKTE